MRGYLLGVALGLLAGGCAGKNTVAGEDKTKSEQLESTVVSWCASTCERFEDCQAVAGCDCQGDVCNCRSQGGDECVTGCQDEMARFTTGDDTCASYGETFKRCIDKLSCDDLDGDSPCELTSTQRQRCPNVDSDNPPQGSDGGGSVEAPIPVSGTGGSAAAGAWSGTAGTGAGAEDTGGTGSGSGSAGNSQGGATGGTGVGTSPVTCEGAYGSGGGPSDNPAISAVICEEGRDVCSDGNSYYWLCVRGHEGALGCSCFVNSQITGSFDPGKEVCPSLSAVDAGCHWSLSAQ